MTAANQLPNFRELYAALEAEPGEQHYKSPQQFKEQGRNLAKFFRVVHFDEDVTPYIHGKLNHFSTSLKQLSNNNNNNYHH